MERQKDRLLWIGGHYQQGTDGEFFDNLNPATGDVICRVAVAGAPGIPGRRQTDLGDAGSGRGFRRRLP